MVWLSALQQWCVWKLPGTPINAFIGSFVGFLWHYHPQAPQTPRQAPDALHEVQPEGGYGAVGQQHFSLFFVLTINLLSSEFQLLNSAF